VPLDPRLDLLTPPPRYDRQPPLDQPTDPRQQAAGRGLRWLVEHRRADGRWEAPRPIAVTALSLLAGLEDHRITHPEYRRFWQRSVAALLAQQQPDGNLSPSPATDQPYEHALATRALAESLPLYDAELPTLRPAVEAAVRVILNGQQTGGGWHYGYSQGRSRSTPMTVVQMDALAAALDQDILPMPIADALQKAAADLQAAQDPDTGLFGYTYRGAGHTAINGYALYGLQLAGAGLSRAARRGWEGNGGPTAIWPAKLRWPLFTAYYNHLAAYNQGGWHWRHWQQRFFPELLRGQHSDGSWTGTLQEARQGTAYATALATLMLQVHRQPPRLTDQQPLPPPGAVYQTDTDPAHTLLSSGWIEAADGWLMEKRWQPYLTNRTLYVECQPRQVAAALTRAVQTETIASTPMSRVMSGDKKKALRRALAWPATLNPGWDQTPTWAWTLLLWQHAWESASRDSEDTVEAQITRRLLPNQTLQPLLQPTDYVSAFTQLTAAHQTQLLNHTLQLHPQLPQRWQQARWTWTTGNIHQLLTSTSPAQWTTDPATQAAYQALLTPLQKQLNQAVLTQLQSANHPITIILPPWYMDGEIGLLQFLKTSGILFRTNS
jgi:hypothetical protein